MNQLTSLRKVVPDDLETVVRIERECFPGPAAYSKRQLEHLAFKGNSTCLVDEGPAGMRGFVIVTFREGSQIAGIETIDVSPRFRGLGTGMHLLLGAEREIKSRGRSISRLFVSEGNVGALSLYKRAGYGVTKHIENYYQNEYHGTRHALQMDKHIN